MGGSSGEPKEGGAKGELWVRVPRGRGIMQRGEKD